MLKIDANAIRVTPFLVLGDFVLIKSATTLTNLIVLMSDCGVSVDASVTDGRHRLRSAASVH